ARGSPGRPRRGSELSSWAPWYHEARHGHKGSLVSDVDLAAICAHPDDAELSMGGTLAREAAQGRRIALVDLTRGEAGSRGTPEIRAREAQASAAILGAVHRE